MYFLFRFYTIEWCKTRWCSNVTRLAFRSTQPFLTVIYRLFRIKCFDVSQSVAQTRYCAGRQLFMLCRMDRWRYGRSHRQRHLRQTLSTRWDMWKKTAKHCLVLLFSPLGLILKSNHLLFHVPSINVAAECAVREPGSFVHAVPVTPSVSELQAQLISACTPFLLCD